MARGRELKVGLFAFIGITILGVIVFLIGDERRLFSRHISYDTSFSDVQGLKVGAQVRMDGIDVGNVTEVEHSENLGDPRIHVRISIVRSEALRLKADAYAKVANKGLLGDKLLELVPGSGALRSLNEPQIRGQDPTDFSNLFNEVGSIAQKTDSVLGNLDRVAKGLADDNLSQDLKSSMHSIREILRQVAEGDGYAHKLIADPAEAERLSRTISNLEQTSSDLSSAASEVRQLISQVRQGPGFAHDVIYDRGMSKTATQLGEAAGEMALTLKGVRDGNGIAKGLLYGDPDQQQIMANLNTMSRDLRDIVSGVKAGRGTVGALLVDPSVYEDMKLLLGNVQRNDVLRALVRYSIKQGENKPSAVVRDPTPSSSGR
jgi:phospholipid/cholesterol/gamma-HCH transport system substrate-binding protein